MDKKPQWIIGIDPGFKDLGYAHIAIANGGILSMRVLHEDPMMLDRSWNERARAMADNVFSLANRGDLERTLICCEDAAYSAKYGSETLAHLRQSLFEVFGRRADVTVEMIPIKTAKKAICGNGNAEKKQVADMAAMLCKGLYPDFPKETKVRQFAMADALSVALGGLARHKGKKWTESASSAA